MITVGPEEISANPKAQLEEIAARREMRDASHKKIVTENGIMTTACQEATEADAEKIEPHS
jgi:hypothetical protein